MQNALFDALSPNLRVSRRFFDVSFFLGPSSVLGLFVAVLGGQEFLEIENLGCEFCVFRGAGFTHKRDTDMWTNEQVEISTWVLEGPTGTKRIAFCMVFRKDSESDVFGARRRRNARTS